MRSYNNNDNFDLKGLLILRVTLFTTCQDLRYFLINYPNILHIPEMIHDINFGK